MSKIFKPAAATTALPYAASASVAISYAAYRLHDRRDLSAKEAEAAHRVLAAISPNGSTAQHLSNLDKFGASVIKETLSPAMVAKWNTRTKEAFAKNANNNIAWNSGRAHFSISKRSQHEKEKQSNLFEEMAKIGSRVMIIIARVLLLLIKVLLALRLLLHHPLAARYLASFCGRTNRL